MDFFLPNYVVLLPFIKIIINYSFFDLIIIDYSFFVLYNKSMRSICNFASDNDKNLEISPLRFVLETELKKFPQSEIYDISRDFCEDFFETKRVVYLPID